MNENDRLLDAESAARLARIDVTVVSYYAEIGLVVPSSEGYSPAAVAELRRVRRLHEDVGLDHAAIEIVLRMNARIRQLQEELRRLRLSLSRPGGELPRDWVESEWEDCQ
ncbi:MAG TPA: chaperone modulator CbpM [Vicinamibacteria bacterium]|nr:chaperone modulator CbpM [Vicinamibacteria bacterium]